MSEQKTIFYTKFMKEHLNDFCYSYEFCVMIGLLANYFDKNPKDFLIEQGYELFFIKENRYREYENYVSKINIDKYEESLNYYNFIKNKESFGFQNIKNIKYSKLKLLDISKYVDNKYKEALINEKDIDLVHLIDQITIKNIFNYFENIKSKFISLINLIEPSNYGKMIKNYVEDKVVISILHSININTIYDLSTLDIDLLLIIFGRNIDKLETILVTLSDSVETIFEKHIECFKLKVQKKPIILDVLEKRNGFYTKEKTLEEIGQQYDLTRERIRQIEKKGVSILLEKKQSIETNLTSYLEQLSDENQMIFIDKLIDISKEKIGYLKLLITFLDINWHYSEEYNCIYYDNNLENLINNTLQNMNKFMSHEEYLQLTDLEKIIVNNRYSFKNNLYKLKGLNISEIYSNLVDFFYPNGMQMSDENCEIINEILALDYGLEPINSHILCSTLARIGYCYIDKGTVINRNKTPMLEKEFIDQIIRYMSNLGSVVYYSSIYDKFKKEFDGLGIKNRYYVKGVIDVYLPKEFKTKRDYVLTDNKFNSSAAAIEQYIDEQEKYIDLKELRKKFPNVADYVFINHIIRYDNIIFCGKTLYKKVDLIEIKKLLNNILENEIEKLFKSLNTNVISIDKLYSRLKINESEIMDKIDSESSFAFFSIVEKILDDKYYSRRPYISNTDNNLYTGAILQNYVKQLNYFNVRIVNQYVSKMNMGGLYSYQNFMIDLSDEYVQVNIDTCIKKELLQISDNALEKIEKEITYFLDSFGNIDVSNTTIYQYLPKLKYGWNKYLLVGICRTYFGEKYDIEYSHGQYQISNYIIKKYKN